VHAELVNCLALVAFYSLMNVRMHPQKERCMPVDILVAVQWAVTKANTHFRVIGRFCCDAFPAILHLFLGTVPVQCLLMLRDYLFPGHGAH
jgi:hypothetical protein